MFAQGTQFHSPWMSRLLLLWGYERQILCSGVGVSFQRSGDSKVLPRSHEKKLTAKVCFGITSGDSSWRKKSRQRFPSVSQHCQSSKIWVVVYFTRLRVRFTNCSNQERVLSSLHVRCADADDVGPHGVSSLICFEIGLAKQQKSQEPQALRNTPASS